MHGKAGTDNDCVIAITTNVGVGRFAPKLANTCLNAGMTKIMITHTTTMATVITEIG